MARIGIAQTTFARFDMGSLAERIVRENSGCTIIRYTVPGVKDLPVAAKKLIEEHHCDIVMALGMPGSKPIDKQCAHEASQGLIQAQLLTNTHVIEVFVHEDEADNEKELVGIFRDRTIKHTRNALALLIGKNELDKYAGKGRRQGHEDVGPLLEG
ncbi:riboflavin synthase [Candidatus Woesearchaeota archaeon]|nr:riboflavin synthase [Candidatus Woesearchaeota archaeon]